ncbi:MAG: hypothetical protein AAGG51_18010 [Cyanobacteria bacterium P01_G01_bin.54]
MDRRYPFPKTYASMGQGQGNPPQRNSNHRIPNSVAHLQQLTG